MVLRMNLKEITSVKSEMKRLIEDGENLSVLNPRFIPQKQNGMLIPHQELNPS